jgi:signal transduction histidine kinase
MVASGYFFIDSIGFYFFVIGALEALAIYTWQFRKMPGAVVGTASQVCKGAWLLFLVLSSTSVDLLDKIFWISLQKVMAVLMPYFWFVFTLKISRQEALIPPVVKQGIFVCVALQWLVLLTNWHGLFWRDAWLVGQTIWFDYGILPWISLVFGYVLSIFNTLLCLRWIYYSAGLRRRQAMLYFTAVSISWVFHMLWFVSALRVIAIPLGFLISGLMIAWIYYRWQLYNMLPLAQTTVVRNMIDGLVVVDEQGYIVDMNAAAKKIFAGVTTTVGGKFKDIAAAWPIFAESVGNSDFPNWETARETYQEGRWYQISINSLKTPGNHLLGKSIVLKDVTLQQQHQTQMLEQQKALSILAERERLGRELHDGAGQIWNYLTLEMQTLRSMLSGGSTEAVEKQVERLIGIIKELNDDARESIVGLKKSATTNNDYFITNLQDYLGWYEKHNNIVIRLLLPSEPLSNLFNYTSEVQLLRIIQEALTNIRKHAQARTVTVSIQTVDGQAIVFIEDDGCGFNKVTASAEKKSFGLQIMAERAAEAGGAFRIESEPGRGTKVIIQFGAEKMGSVGVGI